MSEIDNRVKAALHFAIGKKCEESSSENGMNYSKAFIALLTEVVTESAELFAQDLECFAKHAKRTTVTADDVKLLCRRNRSIQEHLEKYLSNNEKHGPAKGKQRKRKTEIEVIDEDDD
jgi:Histones H3 and H4